MKLKEKLKCLLGNHQWVKFMGVRNIGGGKFSQKYVCKRCRKMKEKVN
tara:strand:- start:134 stop:277 length:144 start_codon:yes stop_codon:yes gene_type:complete